MLDTVRKSVRMLPAERRRWWLAVPIMALVTGAAEAGAAAAVFGLIKIISAPQEIANVPIASTIAPWLPWQDPNGLILQFTFLVAAYHLIKNGLVVGAQYARHMIVGESSAELACTMLRGYLLATYPFHFSRNSSELIRNTTFSVTSVFRALGAASAILSELVVGAGILVVLLAAAPGTTLVVLVALGSVVALMLRWTRNMAHRAGRETHALNREMLQTLQHALGAIKEIKALGREGFFYRTYAEQQRALLSLGYLGVTLEALPPLVVETVFVCGSLLVIAVLTVGGHAGAGGLPLLGLFAYAGFRIIPMANRLTWRLNELRSSAAPIAELYDDYQLVTGREWPDEAGSAAIDLRDAIRLEHVSYTYPGAAAPALRDVSLTIRRGESIGFVGATGAGKSTLVDVIVGLLPPTAGNVTVDDVGLDAAHSRAWRRHIGYVPQSIFLLDDTVRRNVALGIDDADIDDARIREAIRMARLDDVMARLPDGLDTRIGERGTKLSGGERQRVGIARALYHEPAVVVLDEATSALDTVTEADVSRALHSLHGAQTVLVIAHRLSTVRSCDRVALIDGGRLVDCAPYDELLARNEAFRRMAHASDPVPLRVAGER